MKNEKVNAKTSAKNGSGSEGNSEAYDRAVEEAKAFISAPPTREEVLRWLKHDLQSAIYSLSSVLGHPDLLNKMANEMWEHAQKTPDKIMEEYSKKNQKEVKNG